MPRRRYYTKLRNTDNKAPGGLVAATAGELICTRCNNRSLAVGRGDFVRNGYHFTITDIFADGGLQDQQLGTGVCLGTSSVVRRRAASRVRIASTRSQSAPATMDRSSGTNVVSMCTSWKWRVRLLVNFG
jgi:hypothetical protein